MSNTLGAQLKARRLVCGFTREQVAARAGVKADHIRYIEHDKVDFPRKATLAKITRVLGVQVVFSLVEEEA